MSYILLQLTVFMVVDKNIFISFINFCQYDITHISTYSFGLAIWGNFVYMFYRVFIELFAHITNTLPS